LGREKTIVVNLSGRGDKDCVEVARLRGRAIEETPKRQNAKTSKRSV
jgi:hypothetical protein